ncbi:outer kinetochore KNL1 complex subunit KNL1 [Lissotriton helveticus]
MEEIPVTQNVSDKSQRSQRRLSSILKAPRTPLQDLGGGNECTQDFNREKRRKNTRRVSFAEPIKAVAAELQTNVDGQIIGSGKGILSNKAAPFENEDTENISCPITGMDTLLHAPIQIPLQQLQDSDKTYGNKTLFFSDDCEMDMTTNNTILISGNLFENPDTDEKTCKVDFTSFLVSLNSSKDSRSNQEFTSVAQSQDTETPFFNVQPKNSSSFENKISVDKFLASLKSAPGSTCDMTGEDKENILGSDVDFQANKCTASFNTSNRQRFSQTYRGADQSKIYKDEAADLTKSRSRNLEALFPKDAVQKPLDVDKNVFFVDDVKIPQSRNKQGHETVHSNLKLKSNISQRPPMINCGLENQFKYPQNNRKSSVQDGDFAFENKTLVCEDEMDLTSCHTVQINPNNAQTPSNKELPPFPTHPSTSGTFFPGEQTMISVETEQDMDMTKNFTIGITYVQPADSPPSYNENTARSRKHVFPSENADRLLADKDVTKSHIATFEMPGLGQRSGSVQLSSVRKDATQLNFARNVAEIAPSPKELQKKTVGHQCEDMDLTENVSSVVELKDLEINRFSKRFETLTKFNRLSTFGKPVVGEPDYMDASKRLTDPLDSQYSKTAERSQQMDLKNSPENVNTDGGLIHSPQSPQQESTNVTRAFQNEDGALDFTQCHTENILAVVSPVKSTESKSYVLHSTGLVSGNEMVTSVARFPNASIPTDAHQVMASAQKETLEYSGKKVIDHLQNPSSGLPNGTDSALQSVFSDFGSGEETVRIKEDIDVTQIHTVQLECADVQKLTNWDPKIVQTPEKTFSTHSKMRFPGDKTIVLADFNEYMEMAKNRTAVNSSNLRTAGNDTLIAEKLATGCSLDDDMEITKIHTTTLEGNLVGPFQINIVQETPFEIRLASMGSISQTKNDHCTSRGSHPTIEMPSDKTIGFLNEDREHTEVLNANKQNYRPSKEIGTLPKKCCPLDFRPSSPTCNLTEDMNITESHTYCFDHPNNESAVNNKIECNVEKHEDKSIVESIRPVVMSWHPFAEEMELEKSTVLQTTSQREMLRRSVSFVKNTVFYEQENIDLNLSNPNVVRVEKDLANIPKSETAAEPPIAHHFITEKRCNVPCIFKEQDDLLNITLSDTAPTANSCNPKDDRLCLKEPSENAVSQISVHKLNSAMSNPAKNTPIGGPSEKMICLSGDGDPVLFPFIDEMEMTRTHTATINDKNIGATDIHCANETLRLERSVLSPDDVVIGMTKSHTVVADQQNSVKSKRASQMFQLVPKYEKCVEVPESCVTGQMEHGSNENYSFDVKSTKYERSHRDSLLYQFPSGKTVFLQEDMNVSKSVSPDSSIKGTGSHNPRSGNIMSSSMLKSRILHNCPTSPGLMEQEVDVAKSCTVFGEVQNSGMSGNLEYMGLKVKNRRVPAEVLDTVNQDCTSAASGIYLNTKSTQNYESDNPGFSRPLHSLIEAKPVPMKIGYEGLTEMLEIEMDVTRGHIVAIENDNIQKNENVNPSSATEGLTTGVEDMEFAKCQTVTTGNVTTQMQINQSSGTDGLHTCSEGRHMDISKCQSVVIEKATIQKAVTPNSGTVEAEEMDISNCQVDVNSVKIIKTSSGLSTEISGTRNLQIPLPTDRSIDFSADDTMDVTDDHTLSLDQKCKSIPGCKGVNESKFNLSTHHIDLLEKKALEPSYESHRAFLLTNDNTCFLSEDMTLTKGFTDVADGSLMRKHYGHPYENTKTLSKLRTSLPLKWDLEMEIDKNHTIFINVDPHAQIPEEHIRSKTEENISEAYSETANIDKPLPPVGQSQALDKSTTNLEKLMNLKSSSDGLTIGFGDLSDMEMTNFTKLSTVEDGDWESSIALKSNIIPNAAKAYMCPQENSCNFTQHFKEADGHVDRTLCHTGKIESLAPIARKKVSELGNLGAAIILGEKNIAVVESRTQSEQPLFSSNQNIQKNASPTLASNNSMSRFLVNVKSTDQDIASAKGSGSKSVVIGGDEDLMGTQKDGIFVCENSFSSELKKQEEMQLDNENIETASLLGQVMPNSESAVHVNRPPNANAPSFAVCGAPPEFINLNNIAIIPHAVQNDEFARISMDKTTIVVEGTNANIAHDTKCDNLDGGVHTELISEVTDEEPVKTAEVQNVTDPLQQTPRSLRLATLSAETSPLFTVVEKVQKEKKSRRVSLADIQSKLEKLRRGAEIQNACHTAPVSHLIKQLPISSPVQEDPIRSLHSEELEHKHFEARGSTAAINNTTEHSRKNVEYKLKRLPLGIFLPKLPNKRQPIASVSDETIKKGVPLASDSAMTTVNATSKDGPTCTSPLIVEEALPPCLEEGEPNHLMNYEVPEGAWEELCEMEALHGLAESFSGPIKHCSGQKRTLESAEQEEFQKEKKSKNEFEWICDSTEKQNNPTCTNVLTNQSAVETCQVSSTLGRSQMQLKNSCTSTSSGDSRAEVTTIELSQQCSQADSHIFADSSDKLHLHMRFQDGDITVKEFFMLLNVGVIIQKPRFSEIPNQHEVKAYPTQEDILSERYIYQPRLQVFEEDCHALSQFVEELKLCVSAQDTPLVKVNGALWEAMKSCSESELKLFGEEMKKIKSNCTLKSKVLSHKGKVKRYGKLLKTARGQWKQLQSTMDDIDKLLEEVDGSVSELHQEAGQLEASVRAECDCEALRFKTELENLKSSEYTYNRKLLSLEEQKQALLSQISSLKKKANHMVKYRSEYDFSEWEIGDWDDQGAVFTFLHRSIELSVTFGQPLDDAVFNRQPCRKISDVNFESLLDGESAPPSSLLVQRLIFKFIDRKLSLPENYKTTQQMPQFLFDISLVVNRCRLLGEEIEYLMKWGGKFNLLKTEVNNTKVKTLFSSSVAFAKFEVVFCLSDSYPSAPMPFTVLKLIGRIGHEEISTVLSNVPQGTNYIKRAVQQIHRSLLQEPFMLH